jgi:hypothetical protein
MFFEAQESVFGIENLEWRMESEEWRSGIADAGLPGSV